MDTSCFSLFPRHTIEFRGQGELRQELERDYEWFQEANGSDSDITCTFTSDHPDGKYLLGDNQMNAGRSGDSFVLKDRGDYITLRDSWREIRCTPNTRNWRVKKIIEGVARVDAIESELAMTHASAVVYNGKTIVLPAWRHTGKTNTMLELLNRGASFLTDDRLWLNKNGTAHPYPVSINLLPYNFRAFPDLQASAVDRVRGDIAHQINQLSARTNSKIIGGINILSNHILKPADQHFQIEELYPGQSCDSPKEIDAIVLLQTTTAGKPRVEKINSEHLVRSMTQISHREWNGMMHNIAAQYDLLFPNMGSMRETFSHLERREKDIFVSIADEVETYRLFVPRESSWSSDTKQAVINNLLSIFD